MIGALLLWGTTIGAQDQLKETGLALECELRTAQKTMNSSTGPSPDPRAVPVKFFIWFGRLLAAREETGGQEIPMIVDPTQSLAKQGEKFSATSDWPKGFTLRARTPAGTRLLTVFGNRPVPGKLGRFSAWHSLVNKQSANGFTMQNWLVGDCAVAEGVPYTAYAAKRTVQ